MVSSTYIKSANLDQRKKGLVFQLRRTEQVPQWTSQRQQAFALKWVIKQGGITFRKD